MPRTHAELGDLHTGNGAAMRVCLSCPACGLRRAGALSWASPYSSGRTGRVLSRLDLRIRRSVAGREKDSGSGEPLSWVLAACVSATFLLAWRETAGVAGRRPGAGAA